MGLSDNYNIIYKISLNENILVIKLLFQTAHIGTIIIILGVTNENYKWHYAEQNY